MILNCQDQSDSVQSMMKKRQETNVTNFTVLLYSEKETELSSAIR